MRERGDQPIGLVGEGVGLSYLYEGLEWMDLDAVIVKGATRTSGARRGNLPRPLRFARKLPAAGGSDIR
jgi:hypothetical protein